MPLPDAHVDLDALADRLQQYHAALTRRGFRREEALTLTADYQGIILTGNLHRPEGDEPRA